MMSRMLGAPLGGTTRGGHHGVESLALSLITPPNGIGGDGSCFPSSVTVEAGEPGVLVICWADAREATNAIMQTSSVMKLEGVERLYGMSPLTSTEGWGSPLRCQVRF